LNIGSC